MKSRKGALLALWVAVVAALLYSGLKKQPETVTKQFAGIALGSYPAGSQAGDLCFKVSLPGRAAGNLQIDNVEIVVRDAGLTTIAARYAGKATDANGYVSVRDPMNRFITTSKQYDVWLKADGFLGSEFTGLTGLLTGCHIADSGSALVPGDYLGSNDIGLLNVTYAIGAYGDPTSAAHGVVTDVLGHEPDLLDVTAQIAKYSASVAGEDKPVVGTYAIGYDTVHSDSFLDFAGIHTQLTTYGNLPDLFPNSANPDQDYYDLLAKPRILELGVRRVRVFMPGSTNSADLRNRAVTRLKQMGQLGVKADIVADPFRNVTVDMAKQFVKDVGVENVWGVEGANEPDNDMGTPNMSDPNNWLTVTRNYQAALYAAFKADPELQGVRVVGPTFTGRIDESNTSLDFTVAIGDLTTGYSDVGNTHYYGVPYLQTSGTYKYKNAIYRLTPYGNNIPIIGSETGFPTSGSGSFTEAAQAKYVGRRMLNWFSGYDDTTGNSVNFVAANIYRLTDLDPVSDPAGEFKGLLRFDNAGTPQVASAKPAFDTLKRINALLKDTTALPTQGRRLDYYVPSQPSTVRTKLMEKSNGDFVLAVWNNESVLGTSRSMSMHLNSPVTKVDLYDPTTGTTQGLVATQAAAPLASPLSLSVPDAVVFLIIKTQ